ncbi:hypothetical protein APY04_0947 [Hyphomicrobium sulfonivorans]|uniref:Uncharacterized protein n=1 Tax=Hyphomicrobium sulfonivorans TaxID=121290 RepID=A0A109BKM1_HYPSL|nr:hypothetical protein [Hyphomicrobium sulfonivorans]KWT70503.1 hypothetical protein APY04_0947 [Hyphomicrobium sulfonivorans]
MSTEDLPSSPTQEQKAIMDEVTAVLSDATFVDEMRESMAGMWTQDFDLSAFIAAAQRATEQALDALNAGHAPDSDAGHRVATAWIKDAAKAMGRKPDGAFREWLLNQFIAYDARAMHHRHAAQQPTELSGAQANEWQWIVSAMKYQR